MIDHTNALEHENMLLKEKLVHVECEALAHKTQEIKGVTVLVHKFKGYSIRELRIAADTLTNKLPNSIVVLATVDEEGTKVNLIVAISKELTSKIKAGDLANAVATHVGGKGGGRPEMAQAGGTKVEGLDEALATVEPFLQERL